MKAFSRHSHLSFLPLFLMLLLLPQINASGQTIAPIPAITPLPAIVLGGQAMKSLSDGLERLFVRIGLVLENADSDNEADSSESTASDHSAASETGASAEAGAAAVSTSALAGLDQETTIQGEDDSASRASSSSSGSRVCAAEDRQDAKGALAQRKQRFMKKLQLRGCRVRSRLLAAIMKLLGFFVDQGDDNTTVTGTGSTGTGSSSTGGAATTDITTDTGSTLGATGTSVPEPEVAAEDPADDTPSASTAASQSSSTASASGATAASTSSASTATATAASSSSGSLRRIKNSEVTADIGANAKRILKENHSKPYGTEIPFESGGKKYVGRIERHYHTPGGPLKPWGYHPGVSILAVVE